MIYFCLTNSLLYTGDNDLDILYRAACGPTSDDLGRSSSCPPPARSWNGAGHRPRRSVPDAEEFADALAPHAGQGKAVTASLMQQLFGDELRRQTNAASTAV